MNFSKKLKSKERFLKDLKTKGVSQIGFLSNSGRNELVVFSKYRKNLNLSKD